MPPPGHGSSGATDPAQLYSQMAARDEMKTKGHGEYEEIVETEFLKKAPRTACSILPTTSDLRFDQITFQKASKDKNVVLTCD